MAKDSSVSPGGKAKSSLDSPHRVRDRNAQQTSNSEAMRAKERYDMHPSKTRVKPCSSTISAPFRCQSSVRWQTDSIDSARNTTVSNDAPEMETSRMSP